jgi:hypothetical protein
MASPRHSFCIQRSRAGPWVYRGGRPDDRERNDGQWRCGAFLDPILT